ncbi:MAG: TIGR03619 family F420-dependent LLM class oxidoreductase [Dehalococcoidia bacterium]
MKIRIGAGLIGWPFPTKDPAYFWEFVDLCEELDVDSIWLADRIVAPTLSLESMAVMAALAGRTRRMKFGNSVLALPLRNPTVLAKEVATIDFLSGGRMLPAFGLGTDNPAEFEACGVSIKQRAGRTDEAIALMRRLWTEDNVTFEGRYYRTTEATIEPKPTQKPCPPIWIGGRTEAAFRRVGRLGDGWLTSFLSPEEVGHGIDVIRATAAEHGRTVPEDHYGTIISYCLAGSREEAMALAAPSMLRVRSDLPPERYCGLGTVEDLVALIEDYIRHGATKFVLRPMGPPDQILAQTERAARELIPLFHKR